MDLESSNVSPPRKNGELVFDAPWESRAFGIAALLAEHGAYSWAEFSQRLSAAVAADDHTPADHVLPPAPYTNARYYHQWLQALESLVMDRGLVMPGELDARTAEIAAASDHEH